MRCEDVKQLIDEGNLNDEAVAEHLENCSDCSSYNEAALKVRELFSNYSTEDDDEDPELFEAKLLERLEALETVKKPVKKQTLRWLAVAAAVVVLISVSFVSHFNSVQDRHELISSTTSAVNEPIRIVMEYESDADYKDVKVFFKLDEGVEFYSENDEFRKMKSYAWTGDLKKGKNQIPFVVEVIKNGKWKISTEAVFSGFRHRHNIELNTQDRKVAVSMYRLTPEKI